MRLALPSLILSQKKSAMFIRPDRRNFLLGAAATAFTMGHTNLLTAALASSPDRTDGPLKIEAVELIELHGRYTEEAGVNRQQQVNPLDIYDDLRPAPYTDKPSGSKEVLTSGDLPSHPNCRRHRRSLRPNRKKRRNRRER